MSQLREKKCDQCGGVFQPLMAFHSVCPPCQRGRGGFAGTEPAEGAMPAKPHKRYPVLRLTAWLYRIAAALVILGAIAAMVFADVPVLVGVPVVAYALILLGAAEIIGVIIDTEQNTRDAAHYLRLLALREQGRDEEAKEPE